MRKTTILVILLAACGESTKQAADIGLPDSDSAFCVALGADYANKVGTLSVVGLPSLTVVKNVVPGAVDGDPVLRAHGDRLFIVNRLSSNITIVDPTGFTVDAQFSTGAASNPQDIALAGDKAYVTLYDKPDLQVWNLAAGTPTAPTKTISLASYDQDGVPQANSVVVAGNRAFVTLDLLDTENPPSPRGKGKVVVVDTAADAVTGAFDLRFSNPYDFMYARGDKLVVATFADFGGVDGCLEQIATTGEPRALDCLVQNSQVNGVINSIAVTAGDTFIAVSRFDAEFNQQAELRRIDAAGNLIPAAMTPADQVPTDLAYAPSGHLVYSDAKAGGLRVLDVAMGKEITTAPLDIGLHPAAANAIVCMPR